MPAEHIARQFWDALKARDTARALLFTEPDAAAIGGMIVDAVPIAVVIQVMERLWAALPDFFMTDEVFGWHEGAVTLDFCWGGTHTEKFHFGWGDIPAIPPTGRAILAPDRFLFVIEDDQIVTLIIDSPLEGGLACALRQIGGLMPTRAKNV